MKRGVRERGMQRARRARSRNSGSALRPRLSVFRSNRYTYAQLIDDEAGKTLVSASTRSEAKKTGKKADGAAALGEKIAELAKGAGIEAVVFDKGKYKYHGRIRALADSARKKGLKI